MLRCAVARRHTRAGCTRYVTVFTIFKIGSLALRTKPYGLQLPPNSQPQKRTRTEKHGTDTEHSPHTRYHTTLQPIRLSNARKPRQPGSRARPSGARPPKAERAHASPPAGACAKDVRSKAGTEETKKSRYNSSMGCVTGLWSWVRETASTETWRARRSISHA